MPWIQRFLTGSFRGAPFFILSHEATGGRRHQVHEYPGRNVPYVEDLGKATGRYDLEVYVLGEFYQIARERLADACDAEGPATLVHPYLGTRFVECASYAITESSREGGMARFSLSFVQAGENRFPSARRDALTLVDNAATAAFAALTSQFQERFLL